jgi:hypothetical protein
MDWPRKIAASDFNGDGKLDLAVTNHILGTVSILLVRGEGEFDLAAEVKVGERADFLLAADFNRDGRPDLAFAAARPGGNKSG